MLERDFVKKYGSINPPSDALHPSEGKIKLLSTQERLTDRDGIIVFLFFQ